MIGTIHNDVLPLLSSNYVFAKISTPIAFMYIGRRLRSLKLRLWKIYRSYCISMIHTYLLTFPA